MQNILFILNGISKNKGKVGISGGDVRLMEIAKNTDGLRVYFLTTPNGKELLELYGLKKYKKYIINTNNSFGLIANLKTSLYSLLFIPHALDDYNGIVYSSCEHLYDVLPALRLKILNKCRWYAVYHWVEDYPWIEKRGGTPFVRRYLYWLNRWFSGVLIKYFSDSILAVSEQTKNKLIRIKHINSKKIKAVYCGVNYEKINLIIHKYENEKGKKYDAIYMKRLDFGKGILDLLKIWKIVVDSKNNAVLGVIGEGSDTAVVKIKKFIHDNNLGKNIKLLGPLYDFEEKFRVINSSKLFILPSHEENWAIVIGEAMAARVPIIAYDLKEIKPIWKNNVIWVNKGNISEFSYKIIYYLFHPEKLKKIVNNAQDFVKFYDWKRIASIEFINKH